MPWDYPFTLETKYETRYFLIWADQDRQVSGFRLSHINAVSQERAADYFCRAMERTGPFGYLEQGETSRIRVGDMVAVTRPPRGS